LAPLLGQGEEKKRRPKMTEIPDIPHANDNRWTKADLRAYVLEHLELAARIERTRPLTFRERRARQILIDLLHRHG
jgi:hypothetical protein